MRKVVFSIATLILLGGTGYVLRDTITRHFQSDTASVTDAANGLANIAETPPDGVSDMTDPESGIVRDGVFRSNVLGFALEYPQGFRVSPVDEGNDRASVLFEGDGENRTFQVFVSPFDESGPLTAERIHRDVPALEITDPISVVIGDENITALLFKSKTKSGTPTREVWFADNGFLYQVSSPFSFDADLANILKTWKRVEVVSPDK